MRALLLVPAVVLATLLTLSATAHAHGGVYRGPGPLEPPGAHLACDCASVHCPRCSARGLACLEDVSVRRALTRTLARWGDLVEVETRVRFETTNARARFVEGHARVRHAPLFAATAGAVEIGGVTPSALAARLALSTRARRDYLWERNRKKDPLLVLRVDTGEVTLRVFPITVQGPAVAVVRGFALSDDVGAQGVRLYRTGARYLAIVPLDDLEAGARPDFVDPGGGRALFFLDALEAVARYGAGSAREVPCVPALECAVRDHGIEAVTKHSALVAVPKGGGAPKDLTVGRPQPRAPVPPRAPPGHEPLDPEPPPPVAAVRPIASR